MGTLLTPAAWPRVVPFAVFMVLLVVRGLFSGADGGGRWIYLLSVLATGGALCYFWRRLSEVHRPYGERHHLNLRVALLAVVTGGVVFALWIRLTEPWMMLGEPAATFRPVDEDGAVMWSLVAVRWIGAALVVPVMEELFWRSFLMRWIDRPDFESLDPAHVSPKAVGLSTLVFMLAHTQWLAALIAGLAYALLYRQTRSIWAPILAHAVTNGVLGVWVVFYGNWMFW